MSVACPAQTCAKPTKHQPPPAPPSRCLTKPLADCDEAGIRSVQDCCFPCEAGQEEAPAPGREAGAHLPAAGRLGVESFRADPVFGVEVPEAVPGVPAELLTPRQTWADPAAYDAQARKLADMFRKNFGRFENDVDAEVKAAAPAAKEVAE